MSHVVCVLFLFITNYPLAFQDDDYAPFLTVPFGPPVEMDFEETVHYPLTLQDGFDEEWLYNLPFGTGSYRITNEDGLIVTEIAAFHQLHCLRLFIRDMNARNANANLDHSHHCLNYLRQSFLCEADTTLEPKEFFTKNATHYYGHPTRICRDWTVLYDALEDNWRDWRRHHASNTREFFPCMRFDYVRIIFLQQHKIKYFTVET